MDIIEAIEVNHARTRIEQQGSEDEKQYLTYGMLLRAMLAHPSADAKDFLSADRQWEYVALHWAGPAPALRQAFKLGYADTMSRTGGHEAPLKVRDARSRAPVPLALTRHLGI